MPCLNSLVLSCDDVLWLGLPQKTSLPYSAENCFPSFRKNDPWGGDHLAKLWRLIGALKDGGAKGLATFVQTAKLGALFTQIC